MIVDSGDDDAVVRLLLQDGLLAEDLAILHVPDIGTGASMDTEAVKVLARMQHCMETGQPVLLRNASWILSPLYNLFNQNYRITEDDGEQVLYIIVAYGARTHFCRVHPDFYVVLHMPLAEYDQQPGPLKSRFSPVQVSPAKVCELQLKEKVPQRSQRELVQRAFGNVYEFVDLALKQTGGACFAASQPRQTAESLCMLHKDRFVEALEGGKELSKVISPLCTLGEDLTLSPHRLDGAVQTVIIHLMQLARPECVLRLLETLGNEHLYRKAYFQCQHHFSLPSLVKSALEGAAAYGGTRRLKLMVQTRTSSEVLSLLKWQGSGASSSYSSEFWAVAGLGTCSIKVIDLDEINSPALLEEKLASADLDSDEGHTRSVTIIGVDMKGRSSTCVTWLRDVVDKAASERPDVLFVLLLHFPPEVVLSGLGLCPCTFLDSWESFFLDSLGARTAFRADLLLQLMCRKEAEAVDLPQLVCHETGMSSAATDFARRVQLPIGRPPAISNEADEGVRRVAVFYDPSVSSDERAAALKELLHRQPAIWQQLVAAFHESCKASNLAEELATLAERICKGEHMMSLMDSALSRLQLRFNSMAVAFLAQLCSEDGLIGLAQDSTGSVAALLQLMPMPRASDELALRPSITITRNPSTAGLSPAFRLLHQQLMEHVRGLGFSSFMLQAGDAGISALRDRIQQDRSLQNFCAHVNESTLQDYARFVVQLTCQCSPSDFACTTLVRWMTGGTALLNATSPAAALAQLAAVAGAQGGRLCSFARLVRLLKQEFDRDVPDALLSQQAVEGAADVQVAAQLARNWRDDAEAFVQKALVEELWSQLPAHGAPEVETLTWVTRQMRVEHALRLSSEWTRLDSQPQMSRQRLLMRIVAIILEQLETEDQALVGKSLCARFAEHGNHLADSRLDEGCVQLLKIMVDLLKHDPKLHRRLVTLFMLSMADEQVLWQQQTWGRQVLLLIDARAEDEEFCLSEETACFLLRRMRHHMAPAQAAGNRRPAQQQAGGGQADWRSFVREFLEAQVRDNEGWSRRYVPRYAEQRNQGAARDNYGAPRLPDMLFELFAVEAVQDYADKQQALNECYVQLQRVSGEGVPLLSSIQAAAQGYAFSVLLGRWLGSVDNVGDINEAMLQPVQRVLDLAAQTFLRAHVVPMALEIQRRASYAFFQDLGSNAALSTSVPRLPALLVESGLLPARGAGAPQTARAADPSRYLPLSLRSVHGLSPLGDLRPSYQRVCQVLSTALQQSNPAALLQALQHDGGAAGQSKAMLLLALYHNYYSTDRIAMLEPVLGWLAQLLPDAPEEELRFFRCFIAPQAHQLGHSAYANASNDVRAMFALDCRSSLQVTVRHCLINFLALSFLLPAGQRDHFWTHTSMPGALHGKCGFGSAHASVIGGVHYDCGCVFEMDGTWRGGQSVPHWPVQAGAASFVHCYGAFCLNYLVDPNMHQALSGPVLTPGCIQAMVGQDAAQVGALPSDATAQFCYQRVATSMLYLQSSLDCSVEELGSLLTWVCETETHKVLAGTSALKPQYVGAEEKKAAEVEFRGVLFGVFERRAELATALAENGVAAMRQLCPGGGSGTSTFEAALSQEEPSPMVVVLQRFYASHAELESISLAAAVLRLYMFVHEELNVHFQGTLTLQAATDRSLTSIFDEYIQSAARTPQQQNRARHVLQAGMDAFNSLCDKMGGRLVIECGRDEVELKKIDDKTALLALLNSKELPSSENLLFRVLEYLLKIRQDFLHSVEAAADDQDAPKMLKQVSTLLGNMGLAHLIHTRALEDECRMSIMDFRQKAVATKQQAGDDFAFALLVPLILRAALLGKSFWTGNELRRDFPLRSEADEIGGQPSRSGEQQEPRHVHNLPPHFDEEPGPDAQDAIDACTQSLRQPEILELLAILMRASEFVQRWPESDATHALVVRLQEAGFELPAYCQEALQTPSVQVAHLGFLQRHLQERLQTRSFVCVHLPSRLRRPLPPGTAPVLEGLIIRSCKSLGEVDEVIAHIRSHEESFLAQEASPLGAVLAATEPPAQMQQLLQDIPQEVLCRHLFETELLLFAVRLQLAEEALEERQRVETWWESGEGWDQGLDEQEGSDSDDDGWDMVPATRVDMDWPLSTRVRVNTVLRRGMRRRALYLRSHEASHEEIGGAWLQQPSSAASSEEAATTQQPRFDDNMFEFSEEEEALAQQQAQLEKTEREAWAREVIGRAVLQWNRNRQAHQNSKDQSDQLSTQDDQSHSLSGEADAPRSDDEGHAAEAVGTLATVHVKYEDECPEHMICMREEIGSLGFLGSTDSKDWEVHIATGADPIKKRFKVPARTLFQKVCSHFKLDEGKTRMVSLDGACSKSADNPSFASVKFVNAAEIVECDCGAGAAIHAHKDATLRTVVLLWLQEQPDVERCIVTNQFSQLLPLTTPLSQVGHRLNVVDAGNGKCWHAAISETVLHFTLGVQVESLVEACRTQMEEGVPDARVLNRTRGVLKAQETVREIVGCDEGAEASFDLVDVADVFSLKVAVLGETVELEAPRAATAGQGIDWLIAQSPLLRSLGNIRAENLLLLTNGRDMKNSESLWDTRGDGINIQVAVAANVGHLHACSQHTSVRIVHGVTPKIVLQQLREKLAYDSDELCIVDANHKVLALEAALWDNPFAYTSLSVSMPMKLSVCVDASAEPPHEQILELGMTAQLPDIERAVREAGLLTADGDSLIWKSSTGGGCWLPQCSTATPGCLVDLQDDRAWALSAEQRHGEMFKQWMPRLEVRRHDELVRVPVALPIKGEAEEIVKVNVVVLRGTTLAALQEQLSVLFHLPIGQYKLEGSDDAVLDDDSPVEEVIEDDPELHMCEAFSLIGEEREAQTLSCHAVTVSLGDHHECEVKLDPEMPVQELCRVLRWRFQLATFNLTKDIELGEEILSIIDIADDGTWEDLAFMKDVFEHLESQPDGLSTMTCTDVTGCEHTFSIKASRQ